LLVPIYNHFKQFNLFYKELPYNIPIIVVDDGSEGEEALNILEICEQNGLRCIRQEINQGKGKAVMLGLQAAIQAGYTHALQIDADGQHAAKDIEKFFALARFNPEAIINGTPIYNQSVPKSRLQGRKITNFWVKLETLSFQIKDAMCGYRVYPLAQIKPLLSKLYFWRMGFDIEIIVKSYWRGIKIISLDTAVNYPQSGISHFRILKDNLFISILHTYLCCLAPFNLIKRRLLK
jgi:glycosyltransferase involved in cell wall biosynthesis